MSWRESRFGAGCIGVFSRIQRAIGKLTRILAWSGFIIPGRDPLAI
jgi:hypothetical protein